MNIKIDDLIFDRGDYATIINARRIIERDGFLTITLPHSVRVDAGQLAAALA